MDGTILPSHSWYYINITFHDWVIVENIIWRNVIINLGCPSVDNHIPRDDIFDYHPIRECNIYFIIQNIRSFIFYHLRPTMVRGVPKGNNAQHLIYIHLSQKWFFWTVWINVRLNKLRHKSRWCWTSPNVNQPYAHRRCTSDEWLILSTITHCYCKEWLYSPWLSQRVIV